MALIDALTWQTLTGVVNEIRSPNQFVHRMLYMPNQQTLMTEDVRIGVLEGGREIASFVRKNGEAIMVGGISEKEQTVEAPNIRIKRPFTPSELLFGRRPGTRILLRQGESQMSDVQAHLARDLQHMANMVTNAQEWLACMTLQGVIEYMVADQEVFRITFPRPAECNITLETFWDDATPSNVRVLKDLHMVKRVASDFEVPAITDAIMGTEAADAFMALVEGGNIKGFENAGANPNVMVGQATFTSQFTDDGAIFLGTVSGIRFWEYRRTAVLNGETTHMIRPKYVEFVSVSPASERVEYFGAIPDMHALQGGLISTQRFSKAWLEQDPSVMQSLIHSRPLPVPRRPAAHISMQVVDDDSSGA
jgi:hypothetical protein